MQQAIIRGTKTKNMISLVGDFKEATSGKSTGSLMMWNLQLKLSKEMGLVSLGFLNYLDEVTALEELSTDIETEVIPYFDDMIEDLQDLIVREGENDEQWKLVETRDAITTQRINQVIVDIEKIKATVFTSKRIDVDERFNIMHACRSLFEAIQDLVKSVNCEKGIFIMEYGDELEAMLEDAIGKCDDQSLDEYMEDLEDDEEEPLVDGEH